MYYVNQRNQVRQPMVMDRNTSFMNSSRRARGGGWQAKMIGVDQKLRVYLKPKCYLFSNFSFNGIESISMDFPNEKWENILIKLAYIIRENPYFSAKFFHLISQKQDYDELMGNPQDYEEVKLESILSASTRQSQAIKTVAEEKAPEL